VRSDNIDYVAVIGLGTTPANQRTVVRVLLIFPKGEDHGGGYNLALEGDVLSPTSSNNGALLRNIPKENIPHLSMQRMMLGTLMEGLYKTKALTEGALVNVPALRNAFETGLIDEILVACLSGGLKTTLESCDPDSVSRFPDLLFEIGTGIGVEADPEPDPDMGSGKQLSQRDPVTIEGYKPSMTRDMLNMLDYLGKLYPKLMGPRLELMRKDGYLIPFHAESPRRDLLISIACDYAIDDPGPNLEELETTADLLFRPHHGLVEYQTDGVDVLRRIYRYGSMFFGDLLLTDNGLVSEEDIEMLNNLYDYG
jgi:hypothetical protein